MKKLLPIAILCAVLSTELAAQKTVSKTFTGVERIRMNTGSGSAKIQKSKDATVSVQVTYTYSDDNYKPEMQQDGGRLEIKEIFPSRNASGRSDWTVMIPDNIDFKFNTGSGDVDISDVKIDLDAVTGSGEITIANVSGEVKTVTGSGEIRIRNTKADLKAVTGSGDIEVSSTDGELSLTCGSGNVIVEGANAIVKATTGSGNIRTRQLTIAGSSSFTTGSGNVSVVLAATPKVDLSVTSGSGDAEINYNGNAIEGEIVMKASKRHGKIVAPFEFDKTEEIDNYGDDVIVKKTAVRGNGSNRITVSTGSGTAILKK